MATNYLISTESLKKKGLIHQNSDTKILSVAINRVQAMNIQPALGSPLFRALLTRVASDTWSTDYRELMDDYVIPALVSLVDYKVALLSNVKITNKTTGRVSDENITANTVSETVSFRDELHKDAEFYLERLIGFLEDDCGTKYPEYTESITRTNHDLKKIKTGYRINWSK
tara:strand:+ start:1884 stop:2396 length:513 start_codon:yes stop_codon:yes gene_type:complete